MNLRSNDRRKNHHELRKGFLESLIVSVAVTITACGPSAEEQAGTPPSDSATAAQTSAAELVVYKSPTCGCCKSWVEHMQKAGYRVVVHDTDDLTPIKQRYGVPQGLQSCHTALIGGYVVEGHVPAVDVQRLLRERPDIAGVAVAGMPVGSPGMEVPGLPAQPYTVTAFEREGQHSAFARH